MDTLINKIGLKNFNTLVEKFIDKAKEKNILNTIFAEILLKLNND